ncbi:MAG TPA: hypothetical protein VKT78_02565 [Fimbriimonadaceae bacterium]|nr:hypothetical protein [Fimbriimonadaceae bacterium]
MRLRRSAAGALGLVLLLAPAGPGLCHGPSKSSAGMRRTLQGLYDDSFRREHDKTGKLKLLGPDWSSDDASDHSWLNGKPASRVAFMDTFHRLRGMHGTAPDRITSISPHGKGWDVRVATIGEGFIGEPGKKRRRWKMTAIRADEWRQYTGSFKERVSGGPHAVYEVRKLDRAWRIHRSSVLEVRLSPW